MHETTKPERITSFPTAAHQYLTPEIAKAPTRLFYRWDSLRGICNSTTRLFYSHSTVSDAAEMLVCPAR